RPEPRTMLADADAGAPITLGRDVSNMGNGGVETIDKTAAAFPIASLDAIAPGDYFVQAVLHTNVDLNSTNAPGDRYSDVQPVHIDPRTNSSVNLQLTKTVATEQLPPEDQYVKYVRIQSERLTRFHHRPIYLRAGIILPRNFSPATAYPLRVHIGGYGTRYTLVRRLMSPDSEFRRMWLAGETPRFIFLQLDGDGPYGDPYQVNSDNNGPYGDAVTQELIPYVEKSFHAIGQPYARVLDGESTGGWVSLALKVFYPDFFNAVWSSCPDGVDFRGFQIIDIYHDKNAYTDDQGRERPSKRDVNGSVEFTIRHECQMENVLGAGGTWTMSGQQWGAWNATYGPRGRDGRPVPLWDPKTGVIDRSVVEHWKKYDLRMLLEQNWATLGPKLRGKIHISVGEADSYYLNTAVHLLDDFFKKANPPADAHIAYGPGKGHCWNSLSEAQMMSQMAMAVIPSQWREQRSGVTVRLRGVSAVDSHIVWASGNKGTFLQTTDGGNHWKSGAVAGADDLDFRDVHGVDASTAYLMSAGEGEKSRIYKTIDAGQSWALQFTNHDPKAFFDGFAFWDATHGIAFSDPVDGKFPILRTSDGDTWTSIPSENLPRALPGEAAFAASGSSITVNGRNDVWFATSGAVARVFHSEDRGMTWSVAETPIVSGSASAGIFSITFINRKEGFIAGGDYQKEKESNANFAWTKDGGRTWTLGPKLPGYRSAIAAISTSPAYLIAVGPSGVDHWSVKDNAWNSETEIGFDAISFVTSLNYGWAVGPNGRIALRSNQHR
ncbi:MAG TPA: alpha/beta hydrolase-fold protein, partial [Terriglobia bacterium]|nr:alpha/beta hydrolase-fold protein [Terriglobia bacterium]